MWFWVVLAGVGLILCWRCFYSVNITDEAYYLGTVYRLWFGDGMLCDEWNPTQQMCSFWLYPFYVLFRLILGSNEGMILAFRLLYVVFQLLMSGYLYNKLKRFGYISCCSVLFYLLSTAYNINTLSYNTMANSCLIALLVTLSLLEKPDWVNCIFCGIFASIVVMASPYTIFVYLFYGGICSLICLLSKKHKIQIPVALQIKTFFKMSLTALVILVFFAYFTFQNATLEDIVKNIPYIIGDQEHVQRWNVKISDYFRYFREYYLGCSSVPLAIGIVALLDKDRVNHGKWYFGTSICFVIPYMVYHGSISNYVPINFVTVPICFLGFIAYIISPEKLREVFYLWYLPAMVYPLIVQFTSNTGPLAVSAGFMTAGAASVLLCMSWARKCDSRFLKKLVYLLVLLQLILMLYQRVHYVWSDSSISQLNTRVDRGPAKGLFTTEENVRYYNEMYDDLDFLNMKEDDKFLVIGAAPMLYLYAEREVASYSTWQVFTNETRLYRYYEIHDGEGKFPTVIYCVDADETIFDSILVQKLLMPMGYEWEKLSQGIAFYTKR